MEGGDSGDDGYRGDESDDEHRLIPARTTQRLYKKTNSWLDHSIEPASSQFSGLKAHVYLRINGLVFISL